MISAIQTRLYNCMQAVVAEHEEFGSCCDELQHEKSLRGTFDGVRTADTTTSLFDHFGCRNDISDCPVEG